MTAPCWRCGAAQACEHRELDPPVPIPDRVTGTTYQRREDKRKTRNYDGQGYNFRGRRR